ncbi:efflux RND transporter permease subunit [Variovorax guangxiensis]|uniref:Efflux pump membrane transporter n=1 Tax=Variovorax guangxiensis TaxID=1775474 RepID=A0A3S0ZDU3_9BURK|nr:efflux RND transporter permease subunit [Variovorax guangxiensis]RUR70870.1 efflux RND transporter permease subunit [Variovorax guangxiensis]
MIANFFIQRPVFAWVIAILIMLAGGVAIRTLPVSQYPDIAPPTVVVSANYPGASAQAVENSVTQVLEQQLKGIDGLLYFKSTSSSAGWADIAVTFRQGINPDTAQVQVQNKVSQATSRLPQAVQQQGVTVAKSQNNFLLIVALYDETDRRTDTDVADWMASNLRDPISRVDGVGSVQAFGASYAMRIWLDPHRLASYQLMPSDVTAAITAQNTQVSVGEIGARPSPAKQQLTATVTALSRLQTPEQFRDIVLKTQADGAVVRLGDVARVEMGSESYAETTRLNGHPAAGAAVMLAPGANALTTASAVKARIAEMEPSLPAGLRVAYAEDTTRFVKISIRSVIKTLLEAIALVVVVMYLFLQNWRATVIPAITVPVVLLGTFGVLAAFGYSINVLTLFGMVLAIGLLVDDAIVVVENVERVMHEEGLDPKAATIKSMQEITGALVGIAVVVSAVFLPMAFFGGSVGVIYRQFSVTIIASMALSVVVAIVLIPALCARFLRASDAPRTRGFLGAFNRRFDAAQGRYVGLLGRILRKPLRFAAVYAAIVAGMGLLYLGLPGGFLPEEDQGSVMVQLTLPAGSTIGRTDAVNRMVEKHFLETEKDTTDTIFTLSGWSYGGSGQNMGMAFVSLKDWSERGHADQRAQAIVERAGTALGRQQRDAEVYGMVPPPIEGLGQSNGFEFWLQDTSGMGAQKLVQARESLLRDAGKDTRLQSVRANSVAGTPQLQIDIDQLKASALRLSLDDVNTTLGIAWGGSYVNDFIDRGRVKRVYVQADAPYRSDPDDIRQWFVRGATGAMTPFSAFATTRWSQGAPQLERYNGLPAVQIQGAAAHGTSSGTAMAAVETIAKKQRGTGHAWSGLSYQERLSGGQAPLLFALSILVVFLCLAALYESWSVPFSVMLVIPLGVLGAVIAAALRGLSNDIYFQVGLLATIGLSAKNAILIIEFAEAALRRGIPLLDAVAEGARLRLRPILMTSLAFLAGVVPLALATGAGSASQIAIGTGVFGGVLAATALGIFFVPLFYLLVKRAAGRFFRRSSGVAATP